jgi:hypothetical protein
VGSAIVLPDNSVQALSQFIHKRNTKRMHFLRIAQVSQIRGPKRIALDNVGNCYSIAIVDRKSLELIGQINRLARSVAAT